MDSYSRFTRCIFQWLSYLLNFCGFDFLDEHYRSTFMTYVAYFFVVALYISEIYTFLYYDELTKIFALTMFVLSIQVSNFSCSSPKATYS